MRNVNIILISLMGLICYDFSESDYLNTFDDITVSNTWISQSPKGTEACFPPILLDPKCLGKKAVGIRGKT